MWKAKIEATPPDFEFSARGDRDEAKAEIRERVVRYAVQNADFTAKNAVNERRLRTSCGSAVWKLAVGRRERAGPEIAIENPPPETIYPDPAAASIDECEYVACVYRMSAARAALHLCGGSSKTRTFHGRYFAAERYPVNGEGRSVMAGALPADETVEVTQER